MTKKNILLLLIVLLCNLSLISEDYSLFRIGGLYGIIGNNRKIVMQPSYDWIDIGENSIVCSKKGVIEIYNKSLKLLYTDSWVNILDYTENEILITESLTANKKLLNVFTGTISDYNRNERYLEEHGYRDNLELVWESGKSEFLYSIVDTKGNVILTDIEEAHSVYTNRMIAVILKDGRSGFINTKGQLIIETDFYIEPEDIGPRKYPVIRYAFSEKYALVKKQNQKWVQFDLKGRMKEFPDSIEPVEPYYHNGLVLIRDKTTNKFGYMNPKFEKVILCNFDEACSFAGKYAVVKFNNKDAIIDKKGIVYYCDELK